MFENFNFLSDNIDDQFSNSNFGTYFLVAGSESGIRIWIPDEDPGDQNHADADPQHRVKAWMMLVQMYFGQMIFLETF
jgi:hypothetical protein